VEVEEIFIMFPAEALPALLYDIRVVKAIHGEEYDREIDKQKNEADKRPF
jgi:hypothetical protein